MTERMRIDSAGKVGIGTTSPLHPLSVHGVIYSTSNIQLNSAAKVIFGNGNQYVTGTNDTSLQLATGGSASLTVDNSGNVGIGTTSPSDGLELSHINPKIRLRESDVTNGFADLLYNSARLRIRSRNGATNGGIAFEGSNGSSVSEYARFNSVGNLGIGTTSPSSILHLYANDPTITLDDSGTAATIKNASGNIYYNTSSVNRDHIFQGAGTEKIRLTGDGLLGIGTGSPDTILEAEGNSSLPLFLSRQQNSAGVGVGLGFRQYDSTNALHNYASIFGVIEDNTNGAEDGAVTIHTSLAGSLGERMRIDSDGNVGIGTTSPDAQFHLEETSVTPGYSLTGRAVAVFERNAAMSIVLRSSNTGSSTIDFADAAAQAPGRLIYNHSDNSTQFVGNGSERMRIDSSGNVGIGTTSPSEKLQVNGNIQVGVGNSKEALIQGTNSGRVASNPAYSFSGDVDTGMFNPQTDNTIAFSTGGTERMRIDSSGDAYFGTTSDLGGQVNIASNGTSERQLVIADSDNTTGRIAIYHNGSTSTIESQGTSSTGTVQIGGATTGFATTYCTFNSTGVTIAGALSKGSGSFKIDHPLKPETHHLVHSFIEGPQADNLYRGVIQLENGRAVIDLDDWFGMTAGTFLALNRDIQAFVNNSETWDAVRANVQGSQLVIECQNADSNATVSWLVIGERQDKEIYESILTDDNGKIIVEPQKVTEE
jgi:hypothetical protein